MLFLSLFIYPSIILHMLRLCTYVYSRVPHLKYGHNMGTLAGSPTPSGLSALAGFNLSRRKKMIYPGHIAEAPFDIWQQYILDEL